jgi:hypothetical protein
VAGAAGKQARTVEEMNSESVKIDPTIFCTSFKKRRFYSFSKREPDESVDARDILNEKPLEDETLVDPGIISYHFYLSIIYMSCVYNRSNNYMFLNNILISSLYRSWSWLAF